MRLNEIQDNEGARKPRKRIGRGIGSGTGKTSGKGHKGQKARSGGASRYFEGGQTPIYRRLPKRGFKNPGRANYVVINLDTLQRAVDAGKFDAAATIDADLLVKTGVVRRALDGIRVMARGALTTALTLEVAGASKAAIEAVEKAGGKINLSGSSAATASAEANPAADNSEG